MKNSFTLFEIILAITISSIVFIYALNFNFNLLKTNKDMQEIQVYKIDLLSTKLFIHKHLQDIDKLVYKDNTIYFKDSILIDKISSFKLLKTDEEINIKIVLDNKIEQIWKFSNE